MAWGEKRCYAVRTVETIGAFTIESDAPQPRCVTLADTFPPAAPQGVQGIPSEGAINLIWEPNPEKDLAGYIVLRGRAAERAARAGHAGADPGNALQGRRCRAACRTSTP